MKNVSVSTLLATTPASVGYPEHLSTTERPEVLRWNVAVWAVFLEKLCSVYGEEAQQQLRAEGTAESPICALEALRHIPDEFPEWAPFLRKIEWGWTRRCSFERLRSRTQHALLLDSDTPAEIEEELVDMEGLEGLKEEYPDIDWEDLATQTGVLPPPAG